MTVPHNCPRCGAPLKMIPVQVPVYLEHQTSSEMMEEPEKVIIRYDEKEDVADCERCFGAY